MAALVPIKVLGYAYQDKILAAEMNIINVQLPKAPNFVDGGANYSPAAAIGLSGAGGFDFDSFPLNGNVVSVGNPLVWTGTGVAFRVSTLSVEKGSVLNVNGANGTDYSKLAVYGGATLEVDGTGSPASEIKLKLGAKLTADVDSFLNISGLVSMLSGSTFNAQSGSTMGLYGAMTLYNSGTLTRNAGSVSTLAGTETIASGGKLEVDGAGHIDVLANGYIEVQNDGRIDVLGGSEVLFKEFSTAEWTNAYCKFIGTSVTFESGTQGKFMNASKLQFDAGSVIRGTATFGAPGGLDSCAVVIGTDAASSGATLTLNGPTTLRGALTKSGPRAVAAERVATIVEVDPTGTPITLSVADGDIFFVEGGSGAQARIYLLDKTTIVPPAGATMRFVRKVAGSYTVTLKTDGGTSIVSMPNAIGWIDVVYSGTEWVPLGWGGSVAPT